jgi:hypothetical protein
MQLVAAVTISKATHDQHNLVSNINIGLQPALRIKPCLNSMLKELYSFSTNTACPSSTAQHYSCSGRMPKKLAAPMPAASAHVAARIPVRAPPPPPARNGKKTATWPNPAPAMPKLSNLYGASDNSPRSAPSCKAQPLVSIVYIEMNLNVHLQAWDKWESNVDKSEIPQKQSNFHAWK